MSTTRVRRPRLRAPIVVGVGAFAAVGLALSLDSRSSSKPAGLEAAAVPLPRRPAFVPPRPVELRRSRFLAHWAPVLRAAPVRASPSLSAARIARLQLRTAEGTDNIVLVIGRASAPSGELWVRIRLPVLPNNTTGWVPRSALGGYNIVRTHLVVNLERLTATLFRDGRRIFQAPIGAGQPRWPTPRGKFYVRNKLTSFRSPAYGPLAFGTSARSSVLTDWPAGGFVGIHGTNEPGLIPGRISHGCIRLRNEYILRLARLMPVGTPLTVV